MIELVRPADGDVTQYFGNIQPDGQEHAGQDYAYYSGGQVYDAVYAAADGVVLFAGDSRNLGWPNVMYLNPDFNRADGVDSSAGNYIIIQHHRNKIPVALTGYGHLESFEVKAGDIVSAGERIATIGDTGNTRGKHLHFDLMFYPLNYNTPTYGKSDPNPYFTGNIQFQSAAITPKEGFLMALNDQQQADLYWILCTPDGRQYLSDLVGAGAARHTLNAPIQRGGAGAGIGDGLTSLGAMVAWNDAHTIDLMAAAAAEKSGASIEDIKAAMLETLASGVVTVEVDVNLKGKEG